MNWLTTITHGRCSRRAGQELASLSTDELNAMALDVGLPPDQLPRLSARGSSGGEELPRLLRAVGLAPDRMERIHPAVMRDMSLVCAVCAAARRCRRDLDRGWAPVVQRYCPNTETIKALQAQRCRAVP